MENETENKAGTLALICSLLFPIVGVIIYFVKRKEVVNPNAYLYAALAGFVLGLVIRAVL